MCNCFLLQVKTQGQLVMQSSGTKLRVTEEHQGTECCVHILLQYCLGYK